jgi:Family of unknown function (DUF5681)
MPLDPPLPAEPLIAPEPQHDYEVGYRKPPRQSRFSKGRSGNPCGRPRGAKNLKTLLLEVLSEQIIATTNGRRRKITKRAAIVTQLVNRAATGDLPAIKTLLAMVLNIEGNTEPASPETSPFSAADEKVIEQLKTRLRSKKPGSDD